MSITTGSLGIRPNRLADAIVSKQRDVTPRIETWVNDGGTVSLDVPANTFGEIVSIEDFGTGFVRWSIDGAAPDTADSTRSFTTTGPYHAAYLLKNVRLDLVRLAASSANSDFSIMYHIYN